MGHVVANDSSAKLAISASNDVQNASPPQFGRSNFIYNTVLYVMRKTIVRNYNFLILLKVTMASVGSVAPSVCGNCFYLFIYIYYCSFFLSSRMISTPILVIFESFFKATGSSE